MIFILYVTNMHMLWIKINFIPFFRIIYVSSPLEKIYITISRMGRGNKKLMQMSHFTAEKKANIFKTFGGQEKNTGSIEAQIAMLTERINHISNHLKDNKKDFSTNRGLMSMVGRRKRLLTYLSNNNLASYRGLIEKLGLRK